MNVIFLDIDGVLNSHKYLSKTDLEEMSIYKDLEKAKLELLRDLVIKTNSVLVLSSSWRTSLDNALCSSDYIGVSLIDALKAEGLTLFDKTSDIKGDRYKEIKSWLDNHPEVTNFVILDDDDFGWNELRPYWIKTSYYIGLTKELCNEILKNFGVS